MGHAPLSTRARASPIRSLYVPACLSLSFGDYGCRADSTVLPFTMVFDTVGDLGDRLAPLELHLDRRRTRRSPLVGLLLPDLLSSRYYMGLMNLHPLVCSVCSVLWVAGSNTSGGWNSFPFSGTVVVSDHICKSVEVPLPFLTRPLTEGLARPTSLFSPCRSFSQTKQVLLSPLFLLPIQTPLLTSSNDCRSQVEAAVPRLVGVRARDCAQVGRVRVRASEDGFGRTLCARSVGFGCTLKPGQRVEGGQRGFFFKESSRTE